jgi:Aldehyde dehydrogenase family
MQVMTIIPFDTDEEAIAIANDCQFGLSSSVFSARKARAKAIGAALQAGMTSINDFNATYMCQVWILRPLVLWQCKIPPLADAMYQLYVFIV